MTPHWLLHVLEGSTRSDNACTPVAVSWACRSDDEEMEITAVLGESWLACGGARSIPGVGGLTGWLTSVGVLLPRAVYSPLQQELQHPANKCAEGRAGRDPYPASASQVQRRGMTYYPRPSLNPAT